MAIVSNAWRSVVEKTTSALPEGAVQFILTGDEMVRAKPDPWPYLHAPNSSASTAVRSRSRLARRDAERQAAGMRVLVVRASRRYPCTQTLPHRLARKCHVDDLRAIAAGECFDSDDRLNGTSSPAL